MKTPSQAETDLAKETIALYMDLAWEKFPYARDVIPKTIHFAWNEMSIGGRLYKTPTRVAGYALRNHPAVILNSDFIDHNEFWSVTIAHEVAHIVQFAVYPSAKQAHGTEFRHVMRVFGVCENTYHKMLPSNWLSIVCPHCNNDGHYSKNRLTRIKNDISYGVRHRCRKCKNDMTNTFKTFSS